MVSLFAPLCDHVLRVVMVPRSDRILNPSNRAIMRVSKAFTNTDVLLDDISRTLGGIKAAPLAADEANEEVSLTWYNAMVVVVCEDREVSPELVELMGDLLFLQTRDRSARVHHVVALVNGGANAVWRSSAGNQEIEEHEHLTERLRALASSR